MATIQIIKPTPGPTTTERILEILSNHPQGITIREIQNIINRPVSMLQICLKSLIASGQVYVRLNGSGTQRVYYPKKSKS